MLGRSKGAERGGSRSSWAEQADTVDGSEILHQLLPRKLTWNLKMMFPQKESHLPGVHFRFHVSFRGCKDVVYPGMFWVFYIPGAGFLPSTVCK